MQTAKFLNRNTPPHVVTLVLIAGLSALNMNIFLPALPSMASFFNAEYAVIQLAVSAYLAGTAVLQLIIGPLSDRFGRRPIILICMTFFLVATLVCITAQTIEVFLIGRMLQTVIVTGMVLSRAIVRDMVSMEEAASMLGYVTMGMTLVPMIGPAIGGILAENFGWQSTFILTLIFGALVLWIVVFDLGETNTNRSSNFRAQFQAYPELFRSRRFWGYTLTATFASGAFFSFLGGGPFVASEILGLTPTELGYYFFFIAFGYMSGNFLAGRYSRRFGVNFMMMSGSLLNSAGLVASILLFWSGVFHPMSFFGPIFFVGLGNGLTLPNANAGIVSVRPHLAGSASGLGGAILIGGGAALSSYASSILTAEGGPFPLLFVMLITSLCAIVATGYVIYVDHTLKAANTSPAE